MKPAIISRAPSGIMASASPTLMALRFIAALRQETG
jgi:hypothetical protein